VTSKRFLGGDIGGTASRFCLIDQTGAVLSEGKASGATALLFTPDIREALDKAMCEVGNAIAGPVHGAAFGLTGYGPRTRDEIVAIIRSHIDIASENIFISDDIELAYRSLFAPGTGHLVSAGTGSIAIHLDTGGNLLRIGGRGTLIDDAGSGAWIALAALRALYRRLDETGTPGDMSVLAGALYAAAGGGDWSDIRAYIYSGDRGKIGALSKAVGEAAKAGDPFALMLMQQAGEELARLGNILIKRCGNHPVAFIGGVLGLSPIIRETISKTLNGEASFPRLDQAKGAAGLARSIFSEEF